MLFPARLLVLAPAFVLMLIMPPRLWLSIDEPALELELDDEDDELDDACVL